VVPAGRHPAFIAHMAALAAVFWGWDDAAGTGQLAGWLDEIGPVRGAAFAAAEHAVHDDMRPYRPVVVFLSARAPA
jgi:hypothetical protein